MQVTIENGNKEVVVSITGSSNWEAGDTAKKHKSIIRQHDARSKGAEEKAKDRAWYRNYLIARS